MKLYCLCQNSGNKIKGTTQARDYDGTEIECPNTVQLKTNMTVLLAGARQVTQYGSLHYPNVDVLQCRACKTMVVLE